MSSSGIEKTTQEAQKTATMLAESGINLNFAPVVDVNRNADNPVIGALKRSFSDDPEIVSEHAAEWIAEHRRQRVLSCIKHFPGHGSSTSDSHVGFVDVSDVWHESELLPYRKLCGRGLVDAVMTGHLYNQRIDPDFPATMSAKTINGLLRAEIGHDGVVFSDDLQMRAISDRYPLDETVCRSLAAGVDILVFGNNLEYDPDICPKAIDAVMNGIKRKMISEAQVEQALQRVQTMKKSVIGKG